MKNDQKQLTEISKKKVIDAIELLEASLNSIKPYNVNTYYSPKEREPYDALCDRYIRAVEICIKFYKSYELLMYGEQSDTLRDLLNRMEKLLLVSSVRLWIRMREVRNRIVHDYLPEQIQEMYDSIIGELGIELKTTKTKIAELDLENI